MTATATTDDIINELRVAGVAYPNSLLDDAADEIERLRDRLQDAAMHAEQDACAIEQLRDQIKALADERDFWQRQANA